MRRSKPVVAIDGPAGAGKSTVARRAAQCLEYILVDTGALYRAVALAARKSGTGWDDPDGLGNLARDLVAGRRIRLSFARGSETRVTLGDDDVTTSLRAQEIGQGASKVSAVPAVRAALLEMQRAAGRDGGVVIEGRDIGTVVFPDAEAKFFLTASVGVRADRRHRELLQRNVIAARDDIEREVRERDQRDGTRAVAPLRRAPDAELVDSSSLTIDEVVAVLVRRVRAVEARLRETPA